MATLVDSEEKVRRNGPDCLRAFLSGTWIETGDENMGVIHRWWQVAAGFAVCWLLLSGSVSAEPKWVKQAIEQARDFKPDKDAPALILHNTAEGSISEKGFSKQKVRWAARILTNAGIDEAVLSEPITSTLKIKSLKGWQLKSNGKKINLDKKYIAEIDLDHAAGYYDDDRSLIASFPDVKPGDVVAFEYQIEEKDPWTGVHQGFQFQGDLPVVWTRFIVEIPSGWRLHILTQKDEPLEFAKEGNRYAWTGRELKYRPEEPLMPSWNYLVRRVAVSCYTPFSADATNHADWRSVARWLNDLHGERCVAGDSIPGLVSKLCADLPSPLEKLEAIAVFARDDIRYVAVEIGAGRFQPRPAAATFFNKYGDCKDKVTLMRTMLDLAGIRSEAVIAHVGGVVDPEFPTPFQFNHVIVAVPHDAVDGLPAFSAASADGWLYFDPTDETTELGRLSASLSGTYVLKASLEDSTVSRLPSLSPGDRKRRYQAVVELKPDYSIAADVIVTDYGLRAVEKSHLYNTTPVSELSESWQELFAEIMQNPVISDFTTGSDGDSTWVRFHLDGDNLVSEAGDFYLLKTDIFHADRPDDLSASERNFPLFFGPPAEYTTDVTWRLPEGWSMDGPGESNVDSCRLASVDSRIEADSGLHLSSHVIYYGGTLEAEGYQQARRFNKSLRAAYRVRTFLTKTGE